MKRILAVLLAGIMTLSVASCGNTKVTGTKAEGSVVANMTTEPAEVNSMKCSDSAGGEVLRMTMSGLTRLDENDEPVAEIAKDWTVSEDGKTYTFNLVENAKWSNGEPVTARDFVYGWQTVLKKETGAPYAFMIYTTIENGEAVYNGEKSPEELGVKAIDDYTLEVKLVNPIPYFLHMLSFYTFLPVNEKGYTEIGPDNYAKDADKIVTNGPYKMASWTHDDSVQFEKNQDYFAKDRINIDKVKYVMLKDENASLNAWKGNEVDTIWVSSTQRDKLEKEGYEVYSYSDNGSWYLQYNTQKPGLNNKKIRQAINMAIDTDSLCKDVLKNGSLPATGITPPTIAGANGYFADSVGDLTTEYDTAKAKTLLEEGLKEEGMTADQLKLDLVIDDTSGATKQAQFYQEQIQKNLGIKLEIRQMPFKARIAAMNSGDFALCSAGWSPDYNDAMTYLDMFTTTNGNNYGKYSNAEYDKLIADAIKEQDATKREEMLVKAEKILIDDAVIAPLYFSYKLYVTSPKLEGYKNTGFKDLDFTNKTVKIATDTTK